MQHTPMPRFDSDLRHDQTDAALQMRDADEPDSRSTLTVRKDFVRSSTRPVATRSTTPPRPQPLKGHEAFLKALEFAAATIAVEKISDGTKVEGVLRHSDKFSVTIRTTKDGSYTDRVIFKHDISEFYSLTPRRAADAGEGRAA